ncbi:MAG: HEAT repeat domain-containing protein [Acidobacteriota bacterium]
MVPGLRAASIWWASVAAGALYALTALVVIVRRLGFERQRQVLDAVEAGLAAGAAGQDALAAAVASAPLTLLWALGSDASVPRSVHQIIAAALVHRLGPDRLAAVVDRASARSARRIAALRALALTRQVDSWRLLRAALNGSSREVAGATVALLGELEDRRASELLVEALTTGRYPRSRVATALESSAEDIGDLLVPLLSSDDAHVRYWSAMLIRRHDLPGMSGLIEALTTDSNPMVRKAGLYALGRMGTARAAETARRCLGDPVPYVRAYAVRAIAALGVRATLTSVIPLLADRDWWVRTAVKEALERAGADIEHAVIPYLSHPDAFARNGAAEVLQNTGGFERLLTLEASGPSDPQRLVLLEKLASAGGLRMSDGVLQRLPPSAQRRARALLTTVRLSAES